MSPQIIAAPRVEVSPTARARHDHSLSVALLETPQKLRDGEAVVAYFSDDDDADLVTIAPARVVSVEEDLGIAYIRVAWDHFVERPAGDLWMFTATVGNNWAPVRTSMQSEAFEVGEFELAVSAR